MLNTLKLSITQWASVSTVIIIGVLVAALKLQGSKLHRIQVELLGEQLKRQRDATRAKTKVLKDAYEAAKKEYGL